jgi:hypothetical protein
MPSRSAFRKPQHRGPENPVSDARKRQAIGEAEGDNKIAAHVEVIGTTEREAHETS